MGERANGRLYREVEFALPRELNAAERVEVASSFAKHLTGEELLPYTLAVHRGGEDGGNPHAHLMISERANGRDRAERGAVVQAFTTPSTRRRGERGKARPRSPGSGCSRPARTGADQANEALERAGSRERINEASSETISTSKQRKTENEREMARLQHREPGVHIGPHNIARFRARGGSGPDRRSNRA